LKKHFYVRADDFAGAFLHCLMPLRTVELSNAVQPDKVRTNNKK